MLTDTPTADSTRVALRRVQTLTGAMYDDIASASQADPSAHVFAELADQLEAMRATIRRGLGEPALPTDD